MRKIKAMLIEEIFMLLTVILMELSIPKLDTIDVHTGVLGIILVFSIYIILAKGIEVLVEQIVYGKTEKIGFLRKLLRNLFCFILTSLVFYLIFCVFTKTELIAGVLSMAILLLSGGYAFIHLIVSHFIEKVLSIRGLSVEDQYEEYMEDCASGIEINDDYKEDKHEY